MTLANVCLEYGWCTNFDDEEISELILTLSLDVIVIATIWLAVSYYRAYWKGRK